MIRNTIPICKFSRGCLIPRIYTLRWAKYTHVWYFINAGRLHFGRSALNRVKDRGGSWDSVELYIKDMKLTFGQESMCGSPTCAWTVTVPGDTRGVTTTRLPATAT